MKRNFALVLAVIFALGLLAGCNGTPAETAAPAAAATETASSGEPEAEGEISLPICSEPTYYTHWTAVAPYAANLITDPAQDQAIYSLLAERTNIYFEFSTTPAQEEATNFAIIVAGGDLPDVMETTLSADIPPVRTAPLTMGY